MHLRLLNEREKRARLEKLNRVIGAFFSEVGTRLLAVLANLDPELDQLRGELLVAADWSAREFSWVSRRLRSYEYRVEVQENHLEGLSRVLVQETDFLLKLLENPNLLEHEALTELLRAVFHLAEEPAARESLTGLPTGDQAHLAGDIKRVYGLLIHQWLDYMQYLKGNYPYLFSLAMRTNAFDREASPVVQ